MESRQISLYIKKYQNPLDGLIWDPYVFVFNLWETAHILVFLCCGYVHLQAKQADGLCLGLSVI